MKTAIFKQALKYGVVGLGNTLLSLFVIWVMMKVFGFSAVVSNVTGYVAGVLNSFIWNRRWTFKSSDRLAGSAIRFALVFGICYLLQLGLLVYLEAGLPASAYYNQVIAMAFYTALNFLMNKYFTFKKQKG
ncbi:MAG: GtrA family protein [Tannerellaceae bacterium]|jgi:putative flippase GtrA|nr:GtrA family protein [Tannerellaceae bacterium]